MGNNFVPTSKSISNWISQNAVISAVALSIATKFALRIYNQQKAQDFMLIEPIIDFGIFIVVFFLLIKAFERARGKNYEIETKTKGSELLPSEGEKPRKAIALSEWQDGYDAVIQNERLGISFTLRSQSEIESWLKDLGKRTKEISQTLLPPGGLRNSFVKQAEYFEKIASALDAGDARELRKFGKLIQMGGVLIPQSPVGAYILDMSTNTDQQNASKLFALAYLSEINFDAVHVAAIGEEPDQKIAQQLRNFYHKNSEQLKLNRSEEQQTEIDNEIPFRAISAVCSSSSKNIARTEETILKSAAQYHVLEQTILKLEEAYPLNSATAHWKRDAKENSNRSYLGIGLFFLTALLSAGALVGVHAILGDLKDMNSPQIVSRLPIYSFVILISVWLMKHFSRMYVEGQKAASDARFRLALSQVYVDMKASKALEEGRDKKLLETLFAARIIDNQKVDVLPPNIDFRQVMGRDQS
nr:hypothetical protein [uncultured Cohaesibacter sp.]